MFVNDELDTMDGFGRLRVRKVFKKIVKAPIRMAKAPIKIAKSSVRRIVQPITKSIIKPTRRIIGGVARMPGRILKTTTGIIGMPLKATAGIMGRKKKKAQKLAQEPMMQEQEPMMQEPMMQEQEPMMQEPMMQEPMMQEPMMQEQYQEQEQESMARVPQAAEWQVSQLYKTPMPSASEWEEQMPKYREETMPQLPEFQRDMFVPTYEQYSPEQYESENMYEKSVIDSGMEVPSLEESPMALYSDYLFEGHGRRKRRNGFSGFGITVAPELKLPTLQEAKTISQPSPWYKRAAGFVTKGIDTTTDVVKTAAQTVEAGRGAVRSITKKQEPTIEVRAPVEVRSAGIPAWAIYSLGAVVIIGGAYYIMKPKN